MFSINLVKFETVCLSQSSYNLKLDKIINLSDMINN